MADAKVIPFGENPHGGRRRAVRSGGAGAPPRGRPVPESRAAEDDAVGEAAGEAGEQAVDAAVGSPPPGQDGDRSGPGGLGPVADEAADEAVGEAANGAAGGAAAVDGGEEAAGDVRGAEAAAEGAGPSTVRNPWERRIAEGLGFLRRRLTGEYEVDEFGYDPELTDGLLMGLLRPLYEKYFRVEVRGMENVPATGGALIVANHSGTLPWDGLMLQVAVHDHHPADRHLRLLAADLVFALPVVNELARKAGHTLACSEDASRLLARGELVGVMPEGFKGLGKPFAERYRLQRFGRGGFVSTALSTGVPIVPCSIVGAEEIHPMVGNARTLARVLGLPYFPVTPTFPWLGALGAVPLPTKWTIQFGEPIPTDGYGPEAVEDPMLLFDLTDQVRETIQHTLYTLLVQRRSVFF
ncbi:lysophospholipid acyltransferase family protein [Streptomyces sp. NPDC059740]|uniref:lysophospholipid acyltransferase family protein n=1 Tax=Streptomyces sp. NPDC059740 TaxID=3346926 RepID=UPI003660140C